MHDISPPHLAFTITYPGRAYELMTNVGATYKYRRSKATPIHNFNAIRDTGATKSMITPKVIEKLQIPAVTQSIFPGGDFLIGMDIISLGDFAVTRQNQSTVMSFVMPNLREIDFEKEVRKIKA